MAEIVLSPRLRFRAREFCVFHYSNMLSNYAVGDKISDREAEELRELVSFHVDSYRLIGPGIAYFVKAQTSKMNRYGEFVIVRTDNTAVAFSHRDAALGASYKPEPRDKHKHVLCRPLGLPDEVVWIARFSMLDG